MRAYFCLFLSCFLCLALLFVNGYGNENDAPPAEPDRKAGERMVLKIQDVEYAFRWCPPGTFMMGSPPNEPEREDNERQHRVTLSRGFWMLETEVTQAMWTSVMGGNSSDIKSLPAVNVSWNGSQEYIKALSIMFVAPAGYRFSLPTEAQWEYACRAGTTTAFYFGNTLNREHVNYWQDGGLERAMPVGSFPANAWGLQDMHGNVYEWCLDWFGEYPRGAITDPTGAVRGMQRVLRSGSWRDGVERYRSARRGQCPPEYTDSRIGLRLVLIPVE